ASSICIDCVCMLSSDRFIEFGVDGGPAAKALKPKFNLFMRHASSRIGFEVPHVEVGTVSVVFQYLRCDICLPIFFLTEMSSCSLFSDETGYCWYYFSERTWWPTVYLQQLVWSISTGNCRLVYNYSYIFFTWLSSPQSCMTSTTTMLRSQNLCSFSASLFRSVG
ncbi:hypothetical protein BHE74_00036562, partial [Ensete ventricosum]